MDPSAAGTGRRQPISTMITLLLLFRAATGLAPAPSTSAAPRTSYLGSLSSPATAEAEARRPRPRGRRAPPRR